MFSKIVSLELHHEGCYPWGDVMSQDSQEPIQQRATISLRLNSVPSPERQPSASFATFTEPVPGERISGVKGKVTFGQLIIQVDKHGGQILAEESTCCQLLKEAKELQGTLNQRLKVGKTQTETSPCAKQRRIGACELLNQVCAFLDM